MIRYSRDYAIIFGFGHRPLVSDATFRRALIGGNMRKGPSGLYLFLQCVYKFYASPSHYT